METAKKILKDCNFCLEMLEDDTSPQLRRVLYVACVSLLRAIGDVLDRHDKKEVRSRWQRRSNEKDCRANGNPQIYFDFIRYERNNVAHEFKLEHSDDEPVWLAVVDPVEDLMTFFSGDYSDIYWPMTSGPYEGQDVRDLIRESIAWWEEQLQEILQ